MSVTHIRRDPRPDAELVEKIECLLEAARLGHVRTVGLVVVNPLHEVEVTAAGDLTVLDKNLLIGGVSRLFHKIVGGML